VIIGTRLEALGNTKKAKGFGFAVCAILLTFCSFAAMVAGKRLELLKETVRKISRVAAFWDPKNSGSAQQWKESQLPARELGLQLHSIEISSAENFEAAFKEAKANSDAVILMESQFFILPIKTARGSRGQNPATGDLLSGRFCRERRFDVLRCRAVRAL